MRWDSERSGCKGSQVLGWAVRQRQRKERANRGAAAAPQQVGPRGPAQPRAAAAGSRSGLPLGVVGKGREPGAVDQGWGSLSRPRRGVSPALPTSAAIEL